IARHVEPAVVNIDTLQPTADIAETDNEDKTDKTPSNPLYEMFRRQPPRPMRGVGSGFIIDSKGYIVTNKHVIEGASRITVSLLTGERYRGRVIGTDGETDIAVLKIDSDQSRQQRRAARQHARRSHRGEFANRHAERRLQRHWFRAAFKRREAGLRSNHCQRKSETRLSRRNAGFSKERVRARLLSAGSE